MEAQLASNELDNFIDFLYDGLEGYVYLAAKDPDTATWLQEFFHYPSEVGKLKATIRGATNKLEVYIAPPLYKDSVLTAKNPGEREHVKISNVVWTEFDGNAPDWSDFSGPPSYTVQSSIEGHHHCYWRLTEPLTSIDTIEDINRRIVYNFGADNSAWDATQVLRPPLTINHKRQATVSVLNVSDYTYDTNIFNSLAPAPKPEEVSWELGEIPDVKTVIESYTFPHDMQLLITKEAKDIKDRSAALMQLAYGCCEINMKDVEVLSMLLAFDDVLGKFKKRKDRHKQLVRIIQRARDKHPYREPENNIDDNPLFIWGYQDFMSTEIDIDWVLEGMLMDGGNMLMAGPSGIGKTQFTLEVIKHVALGKDFLHYKVPSPKKVLFLSLEMGHAELQIFLKKQDEVLTPSERDLLSENFLVIALGEPWALNLEEGQNKLIEVLDATNPDGLFVDSIGSSIIGNINATDTVQAFTNFVDRIRRRFSLFTWFIHHTRKAQPGSSVNSQDDIYGDMYLNARATSSYLVLPAKEGKIRIRNTKNRLAPKEEDYLLERHSNLTFSKLNQSIDEVIEKTSKPKSNETAGPFQL